LIVCIIQKVNKLPYQRYDELFSVVTSLDKMKETINDQSKCDARKCQWPNLHQNINLIQTGKCNIEAHKLCEQDEPVIITGDSSESLALKRLNDLLSHFKEDMVTNVYSKEDQYLIDITRRLTDWYSLAVKLQHLGPFFIETLEASQCLIDCRQMFRGLKDIPIDIISTQYNVFLHRLYHR
ncbi:unnamed protein product, partial [Meganyctiphanes norvegica]